MGARLLDVQAPPAARALGADRSALRHVDLTLIGCTLLLSVSGLLMVYSSTRQSLVGFGEDPALYLKRQSLFLVVGLVAMAAVALIDYQWLRVYAPVVYLACLVALVLAHTPLGTEVFGAQRGFQIGAFQLSPPLFARMGLVAMVAVYLSRQKTELGLRHVLTATVMGLIPMILVFIQPDIGTTIILAGAVGAVLLVAGARARHLAILAVAASLVILGTFQLHIIQDYQIQRVTSFLDPQADALSAGYNRQQAEIAIGAGGLFGRGYLQGTQTNLDFVPAQHTDFIFTVVGEEFGFLGAISALALFAVLLWRIFRIAMLSRDPLGTYVAMGVAGMFAIQIFVNIGMTVGIMPITGVPLPFLSYGGSALIADLIGIGLLLSIHARRFV